MTKFQVEFFTAMEDAAQAYVDANEGIEIEFFSCASPADVDCQIAQIEDAVVKGFDAMVITPMGNDVIPALDAAADSGLVVVLADNDLADFTKKTAVAATDNVAGGQLAGEYLKSVLKEGDTIGLMEGVRGVPALDARIQGVKDALEGTGVEIIIGGAETKCDSAQGATVAEDLLTREPNLTAIYSACDDPAIAAAKVAKDQGKQVHGRRLRRPADRRPGDHRRRHDGDDRPVPRPDGGTRRRGSGQRRARQPGRAVHRHRHRTGHGRQRRTVPDVPVVPRSGWLRRLDRRNQPIGHAARPTGEPMHLPHRRPATPRHTRRRPTAITVTESAMGCDHGARRRRRALPDLAPARRLGCDEPRSRLLGGLRHDPHRRRRCRRKR